MLKLLTYCLPVLFPVFYSLVIPAQEKSRTHEIGLFGGMAYYTGDINPGGHFKPTTLRPSLGLIYRVNINKRFAYKFGAYYAQLQANDRYNDAALARIRDANFFTHLFEGTAQGEFNFFNYNTYDEKPAASPYLFAGISGFYFNPKTRVGGTIQPLTGRPEPGSFSRYQVALPFGMGVKLKPNYRFLFSLEYGLRKTFTDYLDNVSTTYDNGDNTGYQRGISHTKDWYTFMGLILSVRLGKPPNSCTFE